jgi:glycosyltransferase involved in cell wall biosynthesis
MTCAGVREDSINRTPPSVELTILMPCLNEAETLAVCIRKAFSFLERSCIVGEVLVADNGSTDRSREIAIEEGALVVPVAMRGYGAALLGGIAAARGRYVIMGDADDSYDFLSLMPFVKRLRAGADLVMGNRFLGGIESNAMPFLHRYLGNPVLSWLGRLFFSLRVHDFNCGLRGFNCDRIRELDLRASGMEFASEMVVRASLSGYCIEEVATTLKKDGRSRPPHLRTWSDGWRHLRFLLIYSPNWLFFYPGLFLTAFGLFGTIALLPGEVFVAGIGFDIHTFIIACLATMVGLQSMFFAVISRRFAAARGLIPPSRRYGNVFELMTLEAILIVALIIGLGGLAGLTWCVATWAATGFGPLQYASMLRVLVTSATALAIGMQLAFTGFLAAIMEVPVTRGGSAAAFRDTPEGP